MLRPGESDWIFFRRLLIAAAVAACGYIAWIVAPLFILFFASVLIAVLLTGLAGEVSRLTRLPEGWALAATCLMVAVLVAGILAVFGAQLVGQITQVFNRLPEAVDTAGEWFGIHGAAAQLQEAVWSNTGSQLFSHVARLGYTAVGTVTDIVLVVITAIYLAADPNLYKSGVVKLFPPEHHAGVSDALSVTASALRLWFLGQFAAMVIVGVLYAGAFWIIGLPSAIGLGIIAGLSNFVPVLGPIVGALPALLIAFNGGLSAVLWTLGAIVVVQQLEGNFISPVLQRRAAEIPPALMLLGISLFGALAGILGMIFAVPLTVVIMVLVKKLWVREALGEDTVIPGEADRGRAA